MSTNGPTIKQNLDKFSAVVTPWGKMISLKEAYKYTCRHTASIAVYAMQALRIIEPDYNKRTTAMCDLGYKALASMNSPDFQENYRKQLGIPNNLAQGSYLGGVMGDMGDESQLMAGRIQQFTPERVEKELDTCPWDIVGSELCRMTTAFFTAFWDMNGKKGPEMAVNMCEAKGCGDLHCRVTGEDMVKYKRIKVGYLDNFNKPVGELHVTPREKCLTETQVLREGKYVNPFGLEVPLEQCYYIAAWQGWTWSVGYILYTMHAIESDAKKIENVLRCVCEAAGKASFIEPAGIKGVRDWLGVPGDVNDGRVLGALIGMILDTDLTPYEMKVFTADTVKIDVDRNTFINRAGVMPMPDLIPIYESLYKGMAKTLIDAEWSAWFEDVDKDQKTLHLVIARKVDKYC